MNRYIEKVLDVFIEDENKIYLRKNLHIGFVSTITNMKQVNLLSTEFKLTSPQIAILNYKSEKNKDVYYEYISKNIDICLKDRYWNHNIGDLYIEQVTPLATLLNEYLNAMDFFKKS